MVWIRGTKHTEESKRKMAEGAKQAWARRGHFRHSEVAREHMRQAQQGSKKSAATREKMSAKRAWLERKVWRVRMIVYQCPECFTALPRSEWTEEGWKRKPGLLCKHLFTTYKKIDLEAATTAMIITIGTSGKDMRQFLQALDARRVALVIDTRWLPLSQHKPEFSKNNLCEALKGAGIGYWHCKVLGSPPELRQRLHETNDYFDFFANYHQHMIQQLEALRSVEALVADRQRVALLCSEAKHYECHRSALAKEIFRRLGGSPELVHL